MFTRRHSASSPAHTLWILSRAALLLAVSFAAALPARAASVNPVRETVDILSPKKDIDYNIDHVEARIRLERDIDRKTLVVILNGSDITKRFRAEDHEEHSRLLTAHLRPSRLRAGRNTLIVQVLDQNGNVSLTKRPFYVISGLGATVTGPPSAVSISSNVVKSSDTSSLSSFTIQVNGQTYGPGLSNSGDCPSDTTTAYGMQVLVLNRQTLEKIDYKCFDTSTPDLAFEAYLGGLTNTELVIASSFLQARAPQTDSIFDTTQIGGTGYGCAPPDFCNIPKIYSIIGVPGLSPGQAYETSVGPTVAPGVGDYPTLVGVLTQDQFENYNFLPNFQGAFVRFKVIPGDASGNSASVQIGESPNVTTLTPPALPAGWTGGYWLLLLHRYDLSHVVSSTLYDTYASTSNQDSLAAALQATPFDNLIILTSLPSTKTNAPEVPTAKLKAAIDSLGAAGYGLELETGEKLGVAYTLVSTPNASTQTALVPAESIVSSSKYAAQGESGAISGILAQDHSNLYKPITYIHNLTRAADDTSDTTLYGLYNILAQPSIPWPLPSTSGQGAAYVYLSKQITANFGCTNGSACGDYRSYYTDQNTVNNFCSTEPSSFSPPANPIGFTAKDYTAMQTQLQIEKKDVCNVLDLHDNVTTLFTQSGLNVGLLLNNAGTEVGSVGAPTSAVVSMNQLRLTNLLLTLLRFAAIPGVSQAAGMVQGFFQFGMAYANSSGVSVVPAAKLNLTVAQLASNSVSNYVAVQSGSDTAFQSILQDWGKLSPVGSNIGNQVPGYVWPVSGNATTNILAAFNLSTRTEFYNVLMPVVYSIDGWYRLSADDPINLGYWAQGEGSTLFSCAQAYQARPLQSFVAYHNLSETTVWDTFVITTTKHGSNADFPSSSLISTLLGTPNSDGTGGLNFVPDLLFSANSAIALRYAIKTFGPGAAELNQNCGCVLGSNVTNRPCSPNF
jgi:hypothetical protein